jgi:hypothetical protein
VSCSGDKPASAPSSSGHRPEAASIADGIRSDPDFGGSLAFHVLKKQLSHVERAAAAESCGLLVQVINNPAVKLKGDAALAFMCWPTGHSLLVGFFHYRGTDAVWMG